MLIDAQVPTESYNEGGVIDRKSLLGFHFMLMWFDMWHPFHLSPRPMYDIPIYFKTDRKHLLPYVLMSQPRGYPVNSKTFLTDAIHGCTGRQMGRLAGLGLSVFHWLISFSCNLWQSYEIMSFAPTFVEWKHKKIDGLNSRPYHLINLQVWSAMFLIT